MNKVPYCKFCGQLQGIEAPANVTEDWLKEIGTQECSCYEAERYRKKKAENSGRQVRNRNTIYG